MLLYARQCQREKVRTVSEGPATAASAALCLALCGTKSDAKGIFDEKGALLPGAEALGHFGRKRPSGYDHRGAAVVEFVGERRAVRPECVQSQPHPVIPAELVVCDTTRVSIDQAKEPVRWCVCGHAYPMCWH